MSVEERRHFQLTSLLQAGGFETPAESGTLTNFVEMGQARDKILSLKLDQVSCFCICPLGSR